MRKLLSFLVLIALYSCGDPAGATSATTSGSSSGSSFTSAVSTAELEARELESPNIRVEIGGVPLQGALLIGQFAEQQFRADEAIVEGNAVVFKRDEPYKPGHYYCYFSDGAAVQLLIDQDQTFSLSAPTAQNALRDMKVEGSVENELFYELLKFEAGQQEDFRQLGDAVRSASPGSPEYEKLQADRKALVDQRLEYQNKLFAKHPKSLFTSFKRAGRNPQLRDVRLPDGTIDEQAQVAAFREDFWNDVDFNDIRLLNTPVIFNKLKRYIQELTPQNADAIIESSDKLISKVLDKPEFFKFFANWITLQYEPGKTTVMDGAAIHVHMIQNYFTKERAFWSDSMTVYGLQQRADQMAYSLVGQKGPDITVPDMNGTPRRLYDLKKPFIAVYMYNPECEHCIEETPKFVKVMNELKSELDVYAIALDTDQTKWKNFVKANGMSEWTNVYDPTNRSIFKTYYVDNTPELYLLNKDRVIVGKNLKVAQLKDAIRIAKEKE
ncbi:redoxin domain-containing protein [Neolewinella aurantiaca]|uniref:Redoxin domain-containing protein n=1 Tax=Neolewinella aurantiaca TaxID=2602767 RepID=A0A5C7FRY2_9BACT|nr:redoxin domain-containing protein [Neolewinella aurantiaca]TXF90780.1 redoxin domain-containing protein [Neolewinella aurantiaca]